MAAFLAAGLGASLSGGSLLGASSSAWAQDAGESTADPTKALDLAHRLTVAAKINGRGPYRFLVDTGANASVISEALAGELNLPLVGRVALHGIAGVEQVPSVTAATVSVGRRTRRDMTLSVLPSRFIRAPGILGLDWLGGQGLILDFARNEMRVGSRPPMTNEYTISVPVKSRPSGLHLIEATVAGSSVTTFVDTGSTTTVGNLALMRQAIRLGVLTTPWADIQLLSLTGQVLAGRVAAVRNIGLGTATIQNVPVVFGPMHTFEYWGLDTKPALLIGTDVLNLFDTVALDFTRGVVHFTVPSA
ncbi:MAG: aspartyl protease family protein [Caulobacter sp.]|nr:aspartyl protease family protein [Caulobacter sp.]